MKNPDHRYLHPDVTRPDPVPPVPVREAADDTAALLAASLDYAKRVAAENAARAAAGQAPLSFRAIVAGLRPAADPLRDGPPIRMLRPDEGAP